MQNLFVILYRQKEKTVKKTKQTQAGPEKAQAAFHRSEVVKMSNMEFISYEKFNSEYRTPEWMRAERYEFCDELYGERSAKKSGLMQQLTLLLLSVF
jgi:hypothetical protein